jgi:dipeptidyl aminopeptidase/acylaminoacyl peptidase/thioredoxin-related protein
MKLFLCMALVLPLFVNAQENERGVKFVDDLSWHEVKAKAKAENKYLFVDCYASWCVPCKKMDRVVYPNDTAGNFMNKNFISYKIQLDTAVKDNAKIKKRYADAHDIANKYKVNEFPCFLFFSPEGDLVYRDLGYKNVSAFVEQGKKALLPQNLKYFNALEKYKEGKRDHVILYELAEYAALLGHSDLSKQIASDYISQVDKNQLLSREKILFVLDRAKNKKLADSLAGVFKMKNLDKLTNDGLLTTENLRFINRFKELYGSGTRLFQLCYDNPARVDSVFQLAGWAKFFVSSTITREEMIDQLVRGDKPLKRPDWDLIRSTITEKYKAVDAVTLVLDYQVRYYKLLKNWPEYTRIVIDRVQKYGAFGPASLDFNLNNLAWEIFLYSAEKKELEIALVWSDSAVMICSNSNKANWLDTKANILYKLGRTKEAMEVQLTAIAIDPNDMNLRDHLEKMKTSKNTWPSVQKPVVDTNSIAFFDYGNWSDFSNKPIITDDGNFVAFFYKTPQKSQSLVIRSINGNWKKELSAVSQPEFISDSKKLIFKKKPETIIIQTLGTDSEETFSEVLSHKVVQTDNVSWLAILDKKQNLSVINLRAGKQVKFDCVVDYSIDDGGNNLLLQKKCMQDGDTSLSISWVTLNDFNEKNIWAPEKEMTNAIISKVAINKSGTAAAFYVTVQFSGKQERSVWYCNRAMPRAIKIVDDAQLKEQYNKAIEPAARARPQLNDDGSQVIFYTVDAPVTGSLSNTDKGVEIWSYAALRLITELQDPMEPPVQYLFVINVGDKAALQITRQNEIIESSISAGEWFLIKERSGSAYERWKDEGKSSYYIVSRKTGERKFIKKVFFAGLPNSFEKLVLSPKGKWIIYYDSKLNHFFSYEVITGIIRNITKGIPRSFIDSEVDRPVASLVTQPVWLNDEKTLFLNDNYDLWSVDPTGQKSPVNITNGFGHRNKIKFRFMGETYVSIQEGTVLVDAFNDVTKENGYYLVHFYKKTDPEKLTMGPFVYSARIGRTWKMDPVKAKNANRYVIRRMSATEAPNLFVTSDLKNFNPITEFDPQKSVNWLTTELIKWTTRDGQLMSGIMYKPESFDSSKKYPVIMHFYERRSNELNEFKSAGLTESGLNIPWFVSNGFIVVTPDIKYKSGEPGGSALNCVLSCARFISKNSWIDSTKIALQGHSWGAYQVNYIISKTNFFAAAAEVAGMSDLISDYDLLSHGGKPRSGWLYESGQSRMGKTLWQDTKGYINNSPVLFADKVTTPLLMMHNKNDWQVPWTQGLEWFMALRRLEKKVWMLQYDNGGHSVEDKDALDYTMRLTQFFNHYLKGEQAPKWMTSKTPDKVKGIE